MGKIEDQTLSPHNQGVMAGTKMRCTNFVAALIHNDERMAAAPIYVNEKIDLMNADAKAGAPPIILEEVSESKNEIDNPLEVLLVTRDIITLDQEEEYMSFINDIQDWVTSTQQSFCHYGFAPEEEGGNVKTADPNPANPVSIMEQCQTFV